jgi:hypothetical protein
MVLPPKDTKTFRIQRYENLLDPKIRKPFGFKDTKTFRIQRYENLSDPKVRKPFGCKDTKTFWTNPRDVISPPSNTANPAAVRTQNNTCSFPISLNCLPFSLSISANPNLPLQYDALSNKCHHRCLGNSLCCSVMPGFCRQAYIIIAYLPTTPVTTTLQLQ